MPKYVGEISFSMVTDDKDRAERLMREMVGAAKAVVPQDNKLETAANLKEHTRLDDLFKRDRD